MTPPPPASMPLMQRLMALAQTLQFAWFIGHVTLLLAAARYGLSYLTFNYYSKWAKFSYRIAFIAAAVTYGIVVYKAYRARTRAGKAPGQQSTGLLLASDENVQYLGMALIWLFSKQMPLAVLPFIVYSVFHVATYTRSNLIPTLQPQPQSTTAGAKPQASVLSESIGRFVKEYYDASMTLVALLEISLWVRLLGAAILFQKGSWILLIVYTVFFRARYSQSTFMQSAISHLTARLDSTFANQSMPPAVRGIWEQVKGLTRQLADATEFNQLTRPQGPMKKAQ